MSTFEGLVQEILLSLEGYGGDRGVYGTLTATISAVADTFSVAGPSMPDGSGFSTGLIEVGDELVYAQALDRSTATFTGCLRGWRGSAPTVHPAGTLVRDAPKFPRIAVGRAINDTIRGLYPQLAAVKTTTFTANGSQTRYAVPADCLAVTAVHLDPPFPAGGWTPCGFWQFDAQGQGIDVLDAMPGRAVRVTYLAAPTALAQGDDFAASGLDGSVRDVVIFGACWRLASSLDAGRVALQTADQALLGQNNPVGAGVSLAKHYLGLFTARLGEAANRQRETTPVRKHWVS